MRLCKIEGCEGKHAAKGYCSKHYKRLWKHGVVERTIRDPNEFVIEGNICRIKLYNKKGQEISEAVIDAEDYEKCKGYKWRLSNEGYVVSSENVYLHRYVMNAKMPDIVDHKKEIRLDNRKKELRLCSHSQNKKNLGLTQGNSSGYKGVSKSYGDKWRAYIRIDGKKHHLGCFEFKEQASKAYNDAALKYHGEFARLNKVQ